MPAWNSIHSRYERAVKNQYKAQWLEKHRLILYGFALLPWLAFVRILWWTARVAVPFTVSILVLSMVMLVSELLNWRSAWSAQRDFDNVRRSRLGVRPHRAHHSLRGLLAQPHGHNVLRRRPVSGDAEPDNPLSYQYGGEDNIRSMRAPRPARSKIFGPLTAPGQSDIKDLTRAFVEKPLTNRMKNDDSPQNTYRMLSEHDAQMAQGVRFRVDQTRYQAFKPSRAPGFHQLGPEDLSPTSPTDLANFLLWMGLDYDTLQIWSQRFRQWATHNIVKKLDFEIATAYAHLTTISQDMGEQDIVLTPLSQVISLEEEKEEETWIRARKQSLYQELQQNPNDRSDLKKAYIQALENWELLTSLLSCSWGDGLLPNLPRGYMGMRLKSMAVGTYMKGFQWSRPRQGQGSFFPEEFASDSEILLVLFAAYLAAPGWNWKLTQQRPPESSGGPLYIGHLPKYPAAKFSAMLSRPPRSTGSDSKAIIVRTRFSSTGGDPVFTLMVGGQLALNLSGDRGVFHSLVLFMHYHRLHHGSKIGGRSFSIMDQLEEEVFGHVTTAKVNGLSSKRDKYHY